MEKMIMLLSASMLVVSMLTGCGGCGGCMGCGGNDNASAGDYADDGVMDGSVGDGTDGVVGGDSGGGVMDDARNAIDDFANGVGDAVDDFTGGNMSGSANGNARNGSANDMPGRTTTNNGK